MQPHLTTVRLSHTDASGRIFYARLFDLAHEAVEEFLASLDHSVTDLLKASAYGLPVVHAEANFLSPLRAGDRLAIHVAPIRIGQTSFTLRYRMLRPDGSEAAAAETVHVAVDATSSAKIDLPPRLRAALERVLETP